MVFLPRQTVASAIIVALSIVSATAMAQQAAAPPPAPADKAAHWKHFEHQGPLPGQFIEARLAYIKTALQITPAQTAQWNAVADLMRKQAKARDAEITEFRAKHQDGEEGKRPDPIEALEHRQKALTVASANLGETIAAWKPLYAGLSDSQKEIASHLIAGHGHHGGHHGFDH